MSIGQKVNMDITLHEARILQAHVLGVRVGQLPLAPAPTAEQQAQYQQLVAARASGVPLQYLTQVAYFRDVEVAVGSGVFIPRPETEVMVGWAIDELRNMLESAALATSMCSSAAFVVPTHSSPGSVKYLHSSAVHVSSHSSPDAEPGQPQSVSVSSVSATPSYSSSVPATSSCSSPVPATSSHSSPATASSHSSPDAEPGQPQKIAETSAPATKPSENLTVVELCAGSGAISLALGAELPGLQQYAVEVDDAAFGYLQRNVAGTQIVPVLADMAAALPQLNGQVDLVIVNPPYIPETERDLVAGDVLKHEPELALFSGADGLDAMRVVCAVAGWLLRPGGLVCAEHAESNALGAQRLFVQSGKYREVCGHLDWSQRPRFMSARRAATSS